MLGFHINPQPLAIGFSETFSSNPKVGFKLIKENSSGEIDCLMIKKIQRTSSKCKHWFPFSINSVGPVFSHLEDLSKM